MAAGAIREAAVRVAAQAPVQWVLFGTPKDAEIGEQIAAGLGDSCVNRIGQTTLDQLIVALRECRLLLTNDTGTMHLASLLGVPVVAIFGSTEPGLTGPLGDHHIVLRHHVECSPCFLRKCPIDFRCMKAVADPGSSRCGLVDFATIVAPASFLTESIPLLTSKRD